MFETHESKVDSVSVPHLVTSFPSFYFSNKIFSKVQPNSRITADPSQSASVRQLTEKNVIVAPPLIAPYLMTFWRAKSSADSMGDFIRSTVRKAARLAVYDDMSMRVKNHQIPLTIRVDTARGATSDPCKWNKAKQNKTIHT